MLLFYFPLRTFEKKTSVLALEQWTLKMNWDAFPNLLHVYDVGTFTSSWLLSGLHEKMGVQISNIIIYLCISSFERHL